MWQERDLEIVAGIAKISQVLFLLLTMNSKQQL